MKYPQIKGIEELNKITTKVPVSKVDPGTIFIFEEQAYIKTYPDPKVSLHDCAWPISFHIKDKERTCIMFNPEKLVEIPVKVIIQYSL